MPDLPKLVGKEIVLELGAPAAPDDDPIRLTCPWTVEANHDFAALLSLDRDEDGQVFFRVPQARARDLQDVMLASITAHNITDGEKSLKGDIRAILLERLAPLDLVLLRQQFARKVLNLREAGN